MIDDLKRTMSLCEETSHDSAEESLVVCFVNLHLAHEVVRPRLLLFSELLRIWPESIQFIANGKDINLVCFAFTLFLFESGLLLPL